MYIVGFSGPPHSGKDSIANQVSSLLDAEFNIDSYVMSLALPMREMGMNLLGLNSEDDEQYAKAKEENQRLFERPYLFIRREQKQIRLTGIDACDNLRQFMIWMSESCIKPRYGQDFWARKLKIDLGDAWGENLIVLIPDFGFQSEVTFFESQIGAENVLTVQVARNGCNFAKDSRSYVAGEHSIGIENNNTLGFAASAVLARMVNMGWNLD